MRQTPALSRPITRTTLHYLVKAEQSYLSRISTGQLYSHPKDAPSMTIAEMISAVRTTGTGLIEWAPRVQANDTVTLNWKDDTPREVPKSIILTQALYHATEHRAQIMAILTELGVESPDLQSWQYFDELSQ
ncbi:MAG: hypothetical protein CL608_27445 [Anaerolineaceae bacterium]|nr:hypothetical protein [Anaerolineaceae bacterium]